MNKKKILLETNLSRFDNYIGTVNTKISFILTFNTFILGTMLFKFKDVIDSINNNFIQTIVKYDILIIFVGIIISLIFCILAIKPFLKSGNKHGDYASLLYFGSVSNMDVDIYSKNITNLNDSDFEKDLIHQSHILASTLTDKFNNVSKSFFFIIYFELIPILILIILNIIDMWRS